MRKQKILLVHNYYQLPGGEDTVVFNEKQMLKEHGHKVILYTRSNSELKGYPAIQKLLLPFSTVFNIKTYYDIKKIIKKQQIDIVHVHNTLSLISPSVYYAAKSCKVPVIQTVHNFRMLCPNAVFYRDGHICEDCVSHGFGCAIWHKCYRGSRIQTLACVLNISIHQMTGIYQKINYICLTEFNKQKLLQLNKPGKKQIIDPNKVFIKPNTTFEPTGTEDGYNKNWEQKKGYFLFLGRIEKMKGIDILLDAFAAMPEEKLLLAGTGADFNYYKQIAEKYQLRNVAFLGFLEKTELNRYMEHAAAVVVPSQCYETFGMMIVEAYAAHKPVIAGNIGNIAGLVRNGITGLTFQYHSAQDLKKKIRQFRTICGVNWAENAYQAYVTEFSPEKNYKILYSIYSDIGKKRKG